MKRTGREAFALLRVKRRCTPPALSRNRISRHPGLLGDIPHRGSTGLGGARNSPNELRNGLDPVLIAPII